MAALTDEIVLSNDTSGSPGEAARVQLSTRRLHNPGAPGKLASRPGLELDAELTVAQEMMLLDWIAEVLPDELDATGEAPSLAALREALAPLLAGLPERLKEHLERLMLATAPAPVARSASRPSPRSSPARAATTSSTASRPRFRTATTTSWPTSRRTAPTASSRACPAAR